MNLNDIIKGITGLFKNGKDAVEKAKKDAKCRESVTFTFEKLPENADELKALPEAVLDTPFKAAALTLLALCRYSENADDGIAMLNFLKGPQPLSPREIQFLHDRVMDGKNYVARSFLSGATPDNNYAPATPYKVTVSANPYSYETEGYAVLWLTSGGADSPRQVKLRAKGGKTWFLWEQMLLSDIRKPKSEDPWA